MSIWDGLFDRAQVPLYIIYANWFILISKYMVFVWYPHGSQTENIISMLWPPYLILDPASWSIFMRVDTSSCEAFHVMLQHVFFVLVRCELLSKPKVVHHTFHEGGVISTCDVNLNVELKIGRYWRNNMIAKKTWLKLRKRRYLQVFEQIWAQSPKYGIYFSIYSCVATQWMMEKF